MAPETLFAPYRFAAALTDGLDVGTRAVNASAPRHEAKTPEWPTAEALDARIDALGLRPCPDGRPIRFVSPAAVPGSREVYDASIVEQGRVPTRFASWHDFLNVIVWLAFPKAKLAIHRRQLEGRRARAGVRTHARASWEDSLALFDEGGLCLLVAPGAADRLRRDWQRAAPDAPAHGQSDAQPRAQSGGPSNGAPNEPSSGQAYSPLASIRSGEVLPFVFGHAILEHAVRVDRTLAHVRGCALLLEVPQPGAIEGDRTKAALAWDIAARGAVDAALARAVESSHDVRESIDAVPVGDALRVPPAVRQPP